MRRETNFNRFTPDSEKPGQAAQGARGAVVDQSSIEKRAYELYEQRGRQEGRALEDWLNAEQQLAGAAGK